MVNIEVQIFVLETFFLVYKKHKSENIDTDEIYQQLVVVPSWWS